MPMFLYAVNHLDRYTSRQQFGMLVALSNIYEEKGLIDKVHQVQQQSLAVRSPKLDIHAISVFANTGHYLFQSEQFEAALQVYKTVMAQGAVSQNQILLGRILNNMGICYFNQENAQYTLADSCLQSALAIANEQRDTLQMCQIQCNIADLRFDEYRDADAESLWLEMAQLAEQKGYLNECATIYGNLAFLYRTAEQWQNALAYSQKQNEAQQAMWNRDQLWKQAEAEKKYELDLKQTKLDLVTSENRRKTQQRNAFVLISVLVLLIGLVFVWLYRSKRRANVLMTAKNKELTELNTTKDKLFSIIGHDLRSPILSLKTRSNKMVTKLADNADTKAIELARSNRNALHKMHQLIENVLSWGLSQQEQRAAEFQKLDVSRVVDMVAADYVGLMDEKNISLSSVLENRSFVLADLHNLKAVLRNVFDNAIKNNTEGGSIRISMPTRTLLAIENDGAQIPSEIVEQLRSGQRGKQLASSGLGLWICKDLMELNEGGFDIRPIEHGTRVELTLKPIDDE